MSGDLSLKTLLSKPFLHRGRDDAGLWEGLCIYTTAHISASSRAHAIMRLFQKGVTVGERSPDVEDAGKNKVSSTLGHVR